MDNEQKIENMSEENSKFRPKSVTEFLDGKHKFIIPSYQRGYRWSKKEVTDLLEDIYNFSKFSPEKDYYLQPVVVQKSGDEWIVLDGQQRLTTMLILLNRLKNKASDEVIKETPLYEIHYDTRDKTGGVDFINPNCEEDIDSFYIALANKNMNDWFVSNRANVEKFNSVLFYDDDKAVKFIWYIVENEEDLESIKIFNNLNKGKIRLTNSELIKALFILDSERRAKNPNGKSEKYNEIQAFNTDELVYQWNEIENKLQDDNFWLFLANEDYKPSTRIDILFDFLTNNDGKQDPDFSYRKFQNLFDNYELEPSKQNFDPLWNELSVNNFVLAWQQVLRVYHTFLYWYEDYVMYHYIGFLIANRIKPITIYNYCKNLSKDAAILKLRELIRTLVFKNMTAEKVSTYSYSEDPEECRKILFYFNIETCVSQYINSKDEEKKNQSFRFPFDLFKKYHWDLEHVSSQTVNDLKKPNDRETWLGYIPHIHFQFDNKESVEKWNECVEKSNDLIAKVNQRNFEEDFIELYGQIMDLVPDNDSIKDDTLRNLTLLDDRTNRGYGNALFPTKRMKIIEKEKAGIFIPPCTKSMFLKYYTSDDDNNSQWKNTWTREDGTCYMEAIQTIMNDILGED